MTGVTGWLPPLLSLQPPTSTNAFGLTVLLSSLSPHLFIRKYAAQGQGKHKRDCSKETDHAGVLSLTY